MLRGGPRIDLDAEEIELHGASRLRGRRAQWKAARMRKRDATRPSA